MATTIDSLQIEVHSNSTNAAAGIDALATSLGKLKSNGSVGVAVRNLEKLSNTLKQFTSVASNANKINSLADAVTKLSSAGSFARVINQLNKLPGAFKGLDGLNLNGLDAKFEKIASASTKLSGIKTTGFNSMVNGLAKIQKVTESLDDATIGKFADKVALLTQKLTPLSQKMTPIAQGFKAINSNAKTAASGVGALNNKVNALSLNLSSAVTVIQGIISALRPVIMLLSNAIGQAIEWDGIAQRFGRGFGEQAEEVYTWVQKLNKELGINTQQFMQYSSVYATMLTGFGVAAQDATQMAVGYMELTYDIWAGYNDIYTSLDEAAMAVRSAIAGEVEPVRKAGFTIVEATLEQTAANYGLEISLETATEAQKSYLRYLTLVDQAYAQNLVGTYAKELSTAEGLMRTFNQQLQSLAQAFGSLFLPALTKIMPWLQAFVEVLTDAIRTVASFFGITLQEVNWGNSAGGSIGSGLDDISNSASDAADSMNDTAGAIEDTTQALKDLKRATIGIDELNVISPQSNSGSGSGSGSGDSGWGTGGDSVLGDLGVGSLWDDSIFDMVNDQVDRLKEKILGFFEEWKTEITIIGGLLAALGMAKMLTHLGEALSLGEGFLKVMGTISKLAVTGIIITLQYTLMAEFFDNYMDGEGFKEYVKAMFVGAIGTGILYSMWGPAGLVIGLSVIVASSIKAIIENGGINSAESAAVALTGIAAGAGAITVAWKKLLPVIADSNFGAFVSLLKESGDLGGTLSAAFPKLSTALSGVVKSIGGFIGGLSAGTVAAVVAAIVAVISVVEFLRKNWDEVTEAVKRFFNENIAPRIEEIKEHFDKMAEVLAPVIELFRKLGEKLAPVIEKIKEFFSEIDLLEGISTVFEWLGGIITGVLGGAIGGFFSGLAQFIEGFVQSISGVVQIVGGIIEAIVSLFSGDLDGAREACVKIFDGIKDVFAGLYDMTIGPVVRVVEGIIDWFTDMWDILVGHSIIPDTINAIVDWFLSLPGKVLGSVGNFVTSVIDKFKNLGSGLAEKFSSAWSSVKSWWSQKSNLSSYTPSIGSIKDKLSSAWSTAKSWWDKSKSALSKYTPSIGSIKEKLSSAWSTAKTWWSKNKGSMSYTPSIGSIKDKLSSAWKTAKTWWSNNVKLSIPSLSLKVTYSSVSGWKGAVAKALDLPGWPSLKFAKNGGIFDAGSLIWAGEAGAEVVANAGGGKTGVMNVDQMQDAVYEGVYAAMMSAMRATGGGSGDQAINIYLDGKQITASVEKRQHERGASLVGKQVYSY